MKSSKHKSKIRVVFIFKNFGLIKGVSHIGLGVASANTSATLREHGIDAEVWSILTAEEMVQKLEDDHKHNCHKPITHIIISAPWVPTALLAQLTFLYKHIRFTVVSHSNVGFLAADRNGIKLLREEAILQQYVPNFQLAGNSERFAKWATIAWGIKVVFLPNLYNIIDMKLDFKPYCGEIPLKIGCFGAIRPLKNQITAAAAAVEISKKLDIPTELWLNSGRNEGNSFWATNAIEQLVGNISGFSIKYKPWSPWEDFREFVGTMHLNMQPSYTESFNMVVADSIYKSVPVVASEAITWVPGEWVGNVDDANELADIGISLLNDPYAAKNGQKHLKVFVKDGIHAWKSYLLKND